jgi:hypothetical protein
MYQIPIIGGQLNYPHLYDGMAAFTYMEPPVPRLRKGRNWAFPALSNIKLLDQFSAETIEAVHAALCQSPHGFRRGPIATLPDQDGGRIVFPSPEDAHDLIKSLCAYCNQRAQVYPFRCAMVCYAVIIQAHPFLDGNGRTGRYLFNQIIREVVRSDWDLPIDSISQLSMPSFLLKIRRALYGADWGPLELYFYDAIRLWNQCLNKIRPKS